MISRRCQRRRRWRRTDHCLRVPARRRRLVDCRDGDEPVHDLWADDRSRVLGGDQGHRCRWHRRILRLPVTAVPHTVAGCSQRPERFSADASAVLRGQHRRAMAASRSPIPTRSIRRASAGPFTTFDDEISTPPRRRSPVHERHPLRVPCCSNQQCRHRIVVGSCVDDSARHTEAHDLSTGSSRQPLLQVFLWLSIDDGGSP